MKFKDSAFIFVTGFVLFVIGGFVNVFGITGAMTSTLTRSIYSSSSSSGYGVLTLIGSLLALVGLIQMCMGAYRALAKIDALPVPAHVASVGTSTSPVEPAEAGVLSSHPQTPTPPLTPQHLVYIEQRGEQQPPVQ